MKKVSTAAARMTKNFSQPWLTIGLDLGDRSSWYSTSHHYPRFFRLGHKPVKVVFMNEIRLPLGWGLTDFLNKAETSPR